jgi:hypothetical protein
MRETYQNGDSIGLRATGCDGCNPARINGVFCHETGCPYAWKDKTASCWECGFDFYPDEPSRYSLCQSCQEEATNA